MPINQPPANAPASGMTSPRTLEKSNRRLIGYTSVQRARVGFVKIVAAIGLSGLVAASLGAILAIACTAWAIHDGVPHPLAIMIGYCTLVGSASLGATLSAAQSVAAKASSIPAKREPNYAAWKLVSKLRISDASRLWCGIEPGAPESQESIAWGIALLDAVKRGELTAIPRSSGQAPNGQEQKNPSWSTEIGRDELISWARAHGHSPRFLQK